VAYDTCMSTFDPSRVRKRLLVPDTPSRDTVGAIDLIACATLGFSSEDPEHPVENILDHNDGPGGTFWSSDRRDTPEQLVVEFDAPRDFSRLVYEVEETRLERTQEIRIEVSQDSGRTYRDVLMQEYAFCPNGATFQREDIRLHANALTHLRLTIVPNKGGSGKATLTSLRLYS
jgi:hypothetical protein